MRIGEVYMFDINLQICNVFENENIRFILLLKIDM